MSRDADLLDDVAAACLWTVRERLGAHLYRAAEFAAPCDRERCPRRGRSLSPTKQ
jgi:hypothetical protein